MIRAGEALLGETMTIAQSHASGDVTMVFYLVVWGLAIVGWALLVLTGRS